MFSIYSQLVELNYSQSFIQKFVAHFEIYYTYLFTRVQFIKIITTRETTKVANKMGFKKLSERMHGQPVFSDGTRYISPDVDQHNGGYWKMADSVKNLASKQRRTGTYDKYLKNKVGD